MRDHSMPVADEESHRLTKEWYLQDWTKCLGGLLGWPVDQALLWAKQWECYLDDGNGLFYHEAPMYYMTRMLISPLLRQKIPRSKAQ